ncbi:MAG: rhodanese-like domain-containing protein [Planctomycetota bacterium]
MIRTSLITIALLLIAALPLQAADSAYPDIRHAELVTLLKHDAVTVIDVNGSESFQTGHIPGAIDFDAHKQAGTLEQQLPSDKDALIVAYCANPRCGAWKQAASVASGLGYSNVKHYSAGIQGWQASDEGKAAATDGQTTGATDEAGKKAGGACGACPMGAKKAEKKKKACSACAQS